MLVLTKCENGYKIPETVYTELVTQIENLELFWINPIEHIVETLPKVGNTEIPGTARTEYIYGEKEVTITIINPFTMIEEERVITVPDLDNITPVEIPALIGDGWFFEDGDTESEQLQNFVDEFKNS